MEMGLPSLSLPFSSITFPFPFLLLSLHVCSPFPFFHFTPFFFLHFSLFTFPFVSFPSFSSLPSSQRPRSYRECEMFHAIGYKRNGAVNIGKSSLEEALHVCKDNRRLSSIDLGLQS